ncbi:hypothetical protein ElyMa_001031700 [Elysia marginata]|uniref:PiggyBac transposable element-derived protein domain-containing protein n=1 Tax=Elysia marginata TaxID=1093978 RepID=A0AAV4HPA7_9GAST|nr:hypothetical protein ElyMa_001031700 [Elysia marginata]
MLVRAWQDKKASKPVVIVPAKAKEGNITQNSKQKPSIIADYNMRMNGCEQSQPNDRIRRHLQPEKQGMVQEALSLGFRDHMPQCSQALCTDKTCRYKTPGS